MLATKKESPARFIARIGMLTALSAALSFLEWLLPPVPGLPPGIKLGLANVVVMFTLFCCSVRDAFVLSVLKSVFVFLGRGWVAFTLSLTGSLLSVVVMVLLFHFLSKKKNYRLISVFGAVSHNIGQLCAAVFVLGTGGFLWYYFPVMLVSGVIMGLATGIVLHVVSPVLEKVPLFPKKLPDRV